MAILLASSSSGWRARSSYIKPSTTVLLVVPPKVRSHSLLSGRDVWYQQLKWMRKRARFKYVSLPSPISTFYMNSSFDSIQASAPLLSFYVHVRSPFLCCISSHGRQRDLWQGIRLRMLICQNVHKMQKMQVSWDIHFLHANQYAAYAKLDPAIKPCRSGYLVITSRIKHLIVGLTGVVAVPLLHEGDAYGVMMFYTRGSSNVWVEASVSRRRSCPNQSNVYLTSRQKFVFWTILYLCSCHTA